MTPEEIKQSANIVETKPRLLNDNTMHYCPGCSHGVVHKLIAEVIEEMGAEEIAIGVAPVGCAVMAYNYIDVDWIEAAHGRAPAIATAAKRLNPSRLVFTYQGDGDLAAIGTAETIHAAKPWREHSHNFYQQRHLRHDRRPDGTHHPRRSGDIDYPYGRRVELNGYPLKISEILAMLDGTCYVTRQSVHSAAAVRKAKKAIRKAFENSMSGFGTSVVEIVSTCSSGWKMSPVKSNQWMEEHMFAKYPVGDLKDSTVKP